MTREITLPPSMYISRSKTVIETISLIADFRDFLTPGETVSTKAVAIEVFTGTDIDPENMFYLGLFANGAVLEQRFRLGIPGVIYSILFSITTSAGNAYDITTRLAVLPNAGNAIPIIDSIFLTSQIYPLQFEDAYTTGISMQDGKFLLNPRFGDAYTTGITMVDGTMTLAQIFYTAPPVDFYTTTITMNDGLLDIGQIFYTAPPEAYTTAIAMMDGTMVPGQVFYTNPPENFQTYITMNDGTLV